MNFTGVLKELFTAAIASAFPEKAAEVDPNTLEITEATQDKFGHYQFNGAMKLSKVLGGNPRQIAEKIVNELNSSQKSLALFANLEIAGPGFINCTLKPSFIANAVTAQIRDPYLGTEYLNSSPPHQVVIDFSSPNIAKEMHVGHLRSTIIGDCITRILRFLGNKTLSLNHVGDWGTQFGMLIAYVKEILPTISEATPPNVDLTDLVSWYRASKKRFDEDPEFKKQAQLEVVALQGGDPNSRQAWEHICAISRQAYQKIYDLLDVHLIERGESFYDLHLPEVIKDLEKNKLITISDGAKCMILEGFVNRDGDPLPLILQKSDGGYNYATTDMAAVRHRVQDEKADWIIVVTDAGQSLHFQMVFEGAKKAGYYDPKKVRIDHVPFGMVLNADGKKFKTRSGETEKLIDLLDTAIAKAKEKLQERTPDMDEVELNKAAHVLGINAIKYSDLACHRLSDYIFSYDKMLKFEGNTAAFLLYAYVRVKSIQRKTQVNIQALIQQDTPIMLEEPAEIALGLLLCQFSEALQSTIRELLPNRLTDYLYRLAEKFHVFFHQCRVEGSAQQNSRLLLCEAVAQVLHQGLILLGLRPLEKM